MKAGIVGFEGVGKRTLFQLLTQVAGAGFGRTEQLGMLKVPDERLLTLSRLHNSRKTTPATIDFVLIPSLARGRSDKLDLSSLRTVDVLVHVVRAFDDPSVPHPEGSIDAARDLEMVELELTLADLAVVEKRIERIETDAKKGKKAELKELPLLQKARDALSEGKPLRAAIPVDELDTLRGYALLTAKPMLAVVNVSDSDAKSPDVVVKSLGLEPYLAAPSFGVTVVSARIEAEIAELPPDEAAAFREDLGLEGGMVERIVRAAFDLMQVITFYTAGDTESRAWIIGRNTKAVKAAGAIHSDIERGFIRAEVIGWQELLDAGSHAEAKRRGTMRVEGKTYEVQDGDVINVLFNV